MMFLCSLFISQPLNEFDIKVFESSTQVLYLCVIMIPVCHFDEGLLTISYFQDNNWPELE